MSINFLAPLGIGASLTGASAYLGVVIAPIPTIAILTSSVIIYNIAEWFCDDEDSQLVLENEIGTSSSISNGHTTNNYYGCCNNKRTNLTSSYQKEYNMDEVGEMRQIELTDKADTEYKKIAHIQNNLHEAIESKNKESIAFLEDKLKATVGKLESIQYAYNGQLTASRAKEEESIIDIGIIHNQKVLRGG